MADKEQHGTHAYLREDNIDKVSKLTGQPVSVLKNVLAAAKATVTEENPDGYSIVRIPLLPKGRDV